MSGYFNTVDSLAIKLTEFTQRRPFLVIFALILVAFAVASGARFLEFSNNYRVFFSDENPELTAFEQLQATYTKNDNFLFVLDPKEGTAFTPETLAAVEWLTTQSWQIPYASRVDSITNFQHTYAIDDDLIVEDLVVDAASISEQKLLEIRSIALAEPLLNGLLVTASGDAVAVNVTLQYPELALTEVPEAVAFARNLRAELEAKFPHLDVSITGVSMLNNAFSESGMKDMSTLVPLMFLVILIMAVVAVRSSIAVFSMVVVIMLSGMVGMGTAGLFGVKLTPISASAPIVIMTLAIADSIHILMSLRTFMRSGMAKVEAITEAVRINFLPVTITSLTTIVGFLTLNFTDSPPFWHLGNITAAGIFSAWVLSLTLLPALIRVLPYRVKPAENPSEVENGVMTQFADWVVSNAKLLLVGIGLLSLFLIMMIPKIELNDQWVEYFDERIEFRTDSDHALTYFGMYPIEYSVPSRAAGAISDPDYLKSLEAFTDYLRAQPEVKHVYSLSDIMKRLNQNMHADDQAYYRIPDERELSAQYLLLYEISLPYGLDLNDRVNIDKSATRITVTLGNLSTADTKAFLERTSAWVTENLPDYMQTMIPTSAQVMFTYISDRNIDNMMGGTLVAVLIIALIMVFSLRNIGMGILSLIPNGLPILTTFGAWAVLVGEVGFSVATVASISLGIIVDDTVHLLTKFVRARKEMQLSAVDAIRHAFNHVGTAIIANTFILTSGFLVLMFSAFKVNADMGLLTALSIVFALLLDFLFLPALLVVFSKKDSNLMNEPRMEGANMKKTETNEGVQLGNQMEQHGISKPVNHGTNMLMGLLVGSIFALGVFMPAQDVLASNIDPTNAEVDSAKKQKGYDIAARADRTDLGFGDSRVSLTMVLRNAAGAETTRSLEITTLEKPNEDVGDKSLVRFDKPRDISGTALLSHAKILDPDDQWLFLPALKRVKRIASKNKSGPFVGSEFAFEDFTSLELNKYDYEWLREEPCGEFTCDVVVRYPKYENSGYVKQISWVDQTHYQIRRVDFYNRRNALLKTLTLTDYRKYGEYWRAHKLHMQNFQNKKETELIYDEYQFGIGLKSADMVKSRLSRLR